MTILNDFLNLNQNEKKTIIGLLIASFLANLFTNNFDFLLGTLNTIFQLFASWLFAYVFKLLVKKSSSSYSIFSLWVGWYIVMIGFTIIGYFLQIM